MVHGHAIAATDIVGAGGNGRAGTALQRGPAPPIYPAAMPPSPMPDPRPALHTPLVWAGGGLLLTLTFWLPGVIALFRAFADLFD